MTGADYAIYNVWDNGEFITHASLDLVLDGKIVDTEEWTISSEDGNQWTAAQHAASSGDAWVETQTHTMEERLGPYGIEWQREQSERMGQVG